MSTATQGNPLGSTALKVGVGATLVVLVLAEVVAAFETTMAIQLLYTPGDFFTKDIASLVWIVTAYALVAALATGFVGRLGDQFGRRNVLMVVLLVSMVGSVVSAIAPNFGVLIAGRALQGVTGAVLPLCIGIVRATFPAAKVALGVAVVSTSALIAGAAGMLVGGLLLDYMTWHFIFWSAAALALVVTFLVRAFLPHEPRDTLVRTGKVDYFGGLLFGASIASALYGLTESKTLGWTNPAVAGFIVAGLAGLVAWVFWELRVASPMIDVRMFTNRKFSLGMLATALIAVGPVGMSTILTITIYRTPNQLPVPGGDPIQLPVGLGMSATMAGVLGFVTAAASFATAPLIGKVSARAGARTGLMVGAVAMILGLLVIAVAPTNLVIVMSGILITTLAIGFLYSGMPTVIVECVRADETSAATGVNAVVRTAFQAVASSVVALLIVASPVKLGDHAFTSRTGLNLVIGACILTCLLTLAVVSRIPRGPASEAVGRATSLPDATAKEPA